jgi:hypothetical protein
MNTERLTRGIVNCRCSAYLSGIARIKSSCNLTGKCFEIGNYPYRHLFKAMNE